MLVLLLFIFKNQGLLKLLNKRILKLLLGNKLNIHNNSMNHCLVDVFYLNIFKKEINVNAAKPILS